MYKQWRKIQVMLWKTEMSIFCSLCPIVLNRPFPSFKDPHFQNEAKTFLIKISCISFICMRIKHHFHIKSSAFTLTLKQRLEAARKRFIPRLVLCEHAVIHCTGMPVSHFLFGEGHGMRQWTDGWILIQTFYVLEYITRAYNVNPFLQDPVTVR